MDLQLQERVVLVVGGRGLIGSAIVDRLTVEGARPVVASRTATDGIVMDATDDASVTAGIAEVLDRHGRLDGLVVTAATAAPLLDPSRRSDPEFVLAAINDKAISFLRVANAALAPMTEAGYGRIVGISGQNAFLTGNLSGSVRNAALIFAAKNLADASAGTGVTVNSISPGLVTETPNASPEHGAPGDSTPADTAALAAFLLSPLAGAISGESIAVGHRVRGVTSL